jgi:hypothetical protein
MDRLKKDNDWLGVALGIAVPCSLFGLAMGIKAITTHMISTPFLMILCVGANFLPFNFYSKQGMHKTARGIVLVTILMAFAFFYYKLYVLKDG